MERFLNLWKPKELKQMSKDARADLLGSHLKQILDFFQKRGHKAVAQEQLNALYAKMADKYFINTITYMLDTFDGRPDMRLVTLMVSFLKVHHKELDPAVVIKYSDVIERLLDKSITKLTKKAKIDEYIARELLTIVPEPSTIGGERFVGIYVGQVLRRLYLLAKPEVEKLEEQKENGTVIEKTVETAPVTEDLVELKQLKKMYTLLFGKEMLPEVAVSILLERRSASSSFGAEQMRIWKMHTIFALTVLENLEKADLGHAFRNYIKRRKIDVDMKRDQPRRIAFDQVSAEEFPTLAKRVKQFKEDFPEEGNRFL